MARKYIAFDIETAKEVPGEDFNWKPRRPLGISCVASLSSDSDEPRVWLSRTGQGDPASQMSRVDVGDFVQFLLDAVAEGLVPLSWNGLSFDFDVLAEESGRLDDCRTLARHHVDMMFHVVCEKGFPVALKNAALGLGVAGKLAGVEGINAPTLWTRGQHDLVMDYVKQDVRTTLAVALKAEKQKKFAWTTRKGTTSFMPLPKGWLTVESAAQLPLPDMSWMSSPPKRQSFMSWLSDGKKGN
jgi:hypothetical protein